MANAYKKKTKDIDKYINDINAGELSVSKGYILDEEEQITREVITTLMCNGKIDWSKISSVLGKDSVSVKNSTAYDKSKLEEFALDGIIAFDDEFIKIKPHAAQFVRNVAASLDKLMINNEKSFSKPV